MSSLIIKNLVVGSLKGQLATFDDINAYFAKGACVGIEQRRKEHAHIKSVILKAGFPGLDWIALLPATAPGPE